MEATQTSVSSGYVNHGASVGFNNQLAATSAAVHPTVAPRFEPYRGLMAAYPPHTRSGNSSDDQIQDSVDLPGSHSRKEAPAPPTGVSNCYVFKSRLQEYAQKVGLSTPTYETIREGPSHEPYFRSTVIVGGTRYDSLLGFFNRKAAEQSAAEVALMALSACGEKKESITIPVHETGLCKNVLQEYAQKMNYAIPTYTCKKDVPSSRDCRTPFYTCTVDIGGIQYIGAAARTKKEAEIKAARTALLAIRSSGELGGALASKANYTVVPFKRKVPESAPPKEETSEPKKSRKPRLKKKPRKHMHPGFSGDQIQAMNMAMHFNSNMGIPVTYPNVQVPGNGHGILYLQSSAQVNGDTNPGFSGNQIQAMNMMRYVNSDMGTPVTYPNAQVSGNGQSVQNFQSSAGNQIQAMKMARYVNPDMGTPVTYQNIHVSGNGDSVQHLESSAQLNEATNVIAHTGEPSGGEVDRNIGCGDSVITITDTNSYNSITDIPPVINSSISSQLNTRDPDSGVDQREEAPIITDPNHVKEGNDTQASEHLGAVNADPKMRVDAGSEADQRGEAPTMTEANYVKEGNDDNDVETTALSVNSQASEQLDAVCSDSRVVPEDPAHGQLDATNAPILGSDQSEIIPDVNALE
ncbi:hypothetical protein vseg_020390 [Gypsophila vaccaria]